MIPSASQRDLGEVGEEIILALERNITMHEASDLGQKQNLLEAYVLPIEGRQSGRSPPIVALNEHCFNVNT